MNDNFEISSRLRYSLESLLTRQIVVPTIIIALKKVKSFMARRLPVENLLPQNVGSIINYLQKFTEVAQWGAPSCSRPQPAMDNGVRDGRSNWLVAPPTLHRAVPPELHVLHNSMRVANHKAYCTDWDANVQPSERQANALPVRPLRVCSATQLPWLGWA